MRLSPLRGLKRLLGLQAPDRLPSMPDAFSQSRPSNAVDEQIQFWDHMNENRFEPQDMEYVIARFKIRKENRVLASPAQYPDPFAWELALDQARQEENAYHQRLTQEHGYPDTAGKDWREAHQSRLRFLMGKYPAANWELLLRGQFEGRDRKPPVAKVRPITIQVIEHTKQTVIALTQQREELNAYGKIPAVVEQQDRVLARKKNALEQYGVDPKELLKENRPLWVLVPLLRSETDRLIARVHDLSSLLADMQAQQVIDEDEPGLLTATRRVLNTYRQTLTKFGVDPDTLPVVPPAPLATTGTAPMSNALSNALPVTLSTPLASAVPEGRQNTAPMAASMVATEEKNPSIPEEMSEPAGIPGLERQTLTPQEVADIMGISHKTALRHLKSGQIPHGIKVGGRWMVQQSQFEEWFKGHRDVEPVPTPVAKTAVKPIKERKASTKPEWDDGEFTPSF